jgi:hypothetical protein
MDRQELISIVSSKMLGLIKMVEYRFEVEIDYDSTEWGDLEIEIADTIERNEILSEEEQRINDLINHADDLSDEDRGR